MILDIQTVWPNTHASLIEQAKRGRMGGSVLQLYTCSVTSIAGKIVEGSVAVDARFGQEFVYGIGCLHRG